VKTAAAHRASERQPRLPGVVFFIDIIISSRSSGRPSNGRTVVFETNGEGSIPSARTQRFLGE
jgi:hypothetical protein